MAITIGIRREDKNEWERRVPLTPTDLSGLQSRFGLRFLVQPSTIRTYSDQEYREAGVLVEENIDPAKVVFAVKEIPIELLKANRIYIYFSHVIKGQQQNMPMLRRLLDLGCSLIDYEKIHDDEGRRLIFFGVHAGYAGMIETLRCAGQRYAAMGIETPFHEIEPAYEYGDLVSAKAHLVEIGDRIAHGGLAPSLRPLVIGIVGYGNVSRGCQEILACLPVERIPVAELSRAALRNGRDGSPIVQVVFKEEDMVRHRDPSTAFDLQDYYENPDSYVGRFEEYLPHIDLLMNTAYWDERYPRVVTKEWAKAHYREDSAPRLQVIGDISCDIGGGIEMTLQSTKPDAPCFVYDPDEDSIEIGHAGLGPAIMAVDNLPCELAKESSDYFSEALCEMVVPLASADWGANFDDLNLPDELKRAVIVHKGKLTSDYQYLEKYLS